MEQATEELQFQYRIRPRFHVEVPYSIEELVERMNGCLKEDNATCKGWANLHYAKLFIPKADQHYWSPHLSVSYEESEQGTMVRGRYGPRPAVWTMFIFFYAFIGFAILMVAILGTSYLSLDKSGAILWWIPVLIVLFFSLYLVSFFGQKLGHGQMVTLHHFVENCLGQEIQDN
jgi:hypothetical protein